MCNVAFDWDRLSKLLRVAWVVRNHRGVMSIHSRRAFSSIGSLEEVRFTTILWAIESMSSLHYKNIIFAGDFKDIFCVILKPSQWPAFGYQAEELKRLLAGIDDYKLRCVSKEENRGATFIAQSVSRQGRMQSYVAVGHPSWLFEVFVNESRSL
ncbi:hypothetical protein N665_0103s0004 [Sinapis alba]|nr:hypothetical protein N665_0103s0004 [Sinapis alba]